MNSLGDKHDRGSNLITVYVHVLPEEQSGMAGADGTHDWASIQYYSVLALLELRA